MEQPAQKPLCVGVCVQFGHFYGLTNNINTVGYLLRLAEVEHALCELQPVERNLAGQHQAHEAANAPDVYALVEVSALNQFWCVEHFCAKISSEHLLAGNKLSGYVEVNQLDMPIVGDDHVLWLDVAVVYLLLVQVAHCPKYLRRYALDLVEV